MASITKIVSYHVYSKIYVMSPIQKLYRIIWDTFMSFLYMKIGIGGYIFSHAPAINKRQKLLHRK